MHTVECLRTLNIVFDFDAFSCFAYWGKNVNNNNNNNFPPLHHISVLIQRYNAVTFWQGSDTRVHTQKTHWFFFGWTHPKKTAKKPANKTHLN